MGRPNWYYGKHPPACTCALCTVRRRYPGTEDSAEKRRVSYVPKARRIRIGKLARPFLYSLVLGFVSLYIFHLVRVGDALDALVMMRDDFEVVTACPTDANTILKFVNRDLYLDLDRGEFGREVCEYGPDTKLSLSSERGNWYFDLDLLESAVHERVNAYRTSRNITVLAHMPQVAEIARGHSEDMAMASFFSHSDPLGRDASWRFRDTRFRCGENIFAMGRSASRLEYGPASSPLMLNRTRDIFKMTSTEIADLVVQQWAESPGHDRNMRGPQYDIGGIGVYFAPDTQDLYFTHNLCFVGAT